jgi:hypothetical protein
MFGRAVYQQNIQKENAPLNHIFCADVLQHLKENMKQRMVKHLVCKNEFMMVNVLRVEKDRNVPDV